MTPSEPPIRSDESLPVSEMASSGLLRAGIVIAIVGCVLGLIVLPIVSPGQPLRFVGLVAILFSALLAEGLFRSGRPQFAYIALVWGIWLAISVSAAINGGIRSPVVTAIPVTILLGGLLLGYRTALQMLAATIVLLVFFGFAADTPLLPSAQRASPTWRAIVLLISVAFAFVVVRYVLSNQAANYAAVRALNRNLAEQLERAEIREAELKERTREYTALLTAQSKVERDLKNSKEMFQKAFDGSPLAIVISRLSDGLYLDVSPGWTALFGWTREQLVGRTALDVGIWPNPEARQAWAEKLRKCRHVADMEVSLLTKQHEIRITKMSATVIEVGGEPCVLVFIQDITQWRQAQASLLLSEARFVDVFRTSPVPASIARVADGRFIEINDAFVEQFRRSREDTLGRTSLDTGQWGSQVERLEWISRLKAAGTLLDFETVMYRSDATARTVSISATIGDFGGEQCVIAYLHDITDKRAAEAAIRSLNAELESRVAFRTAELSEANRELEAFSYSISHDLRAPLRGIDGFSRLLEEEYGNRLDETGLEYLNRVRRAAQRMGTLINDLLELSRVSRQAMHWQVVDLSAIAHDTIRTLVETTPERKVSVHIESGCTVQGDPLLLQSVLENLIGNAWKYSSKTENATVEFGSTRVGAGGTAFYVRDNGAGFDMAYATWLFTPFQRLHGADEFEGSGIGLASAARVIKRHGGHIWAEAAPDKGACFYFTLSADSPSEITQ